MTNRLNKTSICSVVFLDIAEYSSRPVSEQIDEKTLFNKLVAEAVKNIAQSERIIVDTGDGAAISLTGEPEEALFVSLAIRNAILEHNKNTESPLMVRIGINLGSVRVVSDINGQLNVIGDAINVAQRIMSFAEPNQILVSRSYFEVTSRLTKDFTNMFSYFGIKQDKYVREHEVYQIVTGADEVIGKDGTAPDPVTTHGWKQQQTSDKATATTIGANEHNKASDKAKKDNKNYYLWATIPAIFSALILVIFSQAKELEPSKQKLTLPSQVAGNNAKLETLPPLVALQESKSPEAKVADKPVKKHKEKVNVARVNLAKVKPLEPVEHAVVEHHARKVESKASVSACSQAAIAMNQCVK